MERINIIDLEPGLILAEDVVASNGRMLLGKGSVLKEQHIKVLNIWGVTEISVVNIAETGAPEDTTDLKPPISSAAKEYLDEIFRDIAVEDEFTAELYRICLLEFSERIEGEWEPDFPNVYRPGSRLDDTDEKIPSIDSLLGSDIALSSLPNIYYQLLEALDDPTCSMQYLADIIIKESSLSARILKIANSPLYGFSGRIDTMTDAITLIGTRELSHLAFGMSLVMQFKSISTEIITLKDFWIHSLACGVFAKLIAARKKQIAWERYFIAGMLHDIGLLIMFNEIPETISRIIYRSLEEAIPQHTMEKRVLGWDHSDLASQLFSNWHIPASITEAVAGHHNPPSSLEPLDAAIIHLADIMATALRYGSSGSLYVPPINEAAMEILALSPSVLAITISQAKRQIGEIAGVFLR